MTFLDLCAGIGGFSLGLEWAGMTCKGQVEYDKFCSRVLQKHWPDVPRWEDIMTLAPASLPTVDLICGGYPCQPFSLAGKRQGTADDRHLWPYFRAIIAHIRPAWCLFENVAGHVSMGLDTVLSDLGSEGYSCQALVIPACAVDAIHRRDRLWIVAHSHGLSFQRRQVKTAQRTENAGEKQLAGFLLTGARASVSSVRAYGNNYGFSHRLDGCRRNRALGNAVVPQLVAMLAKAVMETEKIWSRYEQPL